MHEVEAGDVLGGASTRHIGERMTRIRVRGDGEVAGVGETADGRDNAPPAR
jgi:hypothetical protein